MRLISERKKLIPSANLSGQSRTKLKHWFTPYKLYIGMIKVTKNAIGDHENFFLVFFTFLYSNTRWESLKDNFHELIFTIDKIVIFGIVNPIILTKLSLFQRGWWIEKDL